jgi:hypothetical protein
MDRTLWYVRRMSDSRGFMRTKYWSQLFGGIDMDTRLIELAEECERWSPPRARELVQKISLRGGLELLKKK